MSAAPALTVASLRRFERDPVTRALRAQVIVLHELAVKRRAEVDAYIAPVFARFEFYADRWPERRSCGGERITNPRDLYLSADDAQCARFYAACDAAHREHGHQLPEGHCPALRAENDAISAENALLAHAALSLGIEGLGDTYGELRDRALALFMHPPQKSTDKESLTVRRPSHTAPAIASAPADPQAKP